MMVHVGGKCKGTTARSHQQTEQEANDEDSTHITSERVETSPNPISKKSIDVKDGG